jgi:hypothetical protein
MSAEVSPYVASAFRRMNDTPLFAKPLDPRALSIALHEMVTPVGGGGNLPPTISRRRQ